MTERRRCPGCHKWHRFKRTYCSKVCREEADKRRRTHPEVDFDERIAEADDLRKRIERVLGNGSEGGDSRTKIWQELMR